MECKRSRQGNMKPGKVGAMKAIVKGGDDREPQEIEMDGKRYVTIVCCKQIGADENNVDVKMGYVNNQPAEVVRDTGCTAVVVKGKFVKPNQYTGAKREVRMVNNTAEQYSVASIEIRTPYYSGMVPAIVMNDPMYDLVIGNIPGVKSPSNPDPSFDKGDRYKMSKQVDNG